MDRSCEPVQRMILLVTRSHLAERCAIQIESVVDEGVQTASSLLRARTLFKTGRFRAIVFDECLLQAEPVLAESLLSCCRGAGTIFVNMAISGIDRIARQVKTATRHDEQLQRQAEI